MEFVDRPLEPFGELLLEMSIPSDLSYKMPLALRMVKELVQHECLPTGANPRAELVLDEALTNAIMHGNKNEPHRKVHVQLFADQERWGLIVEDEGEGFGAERVPSRDNILEVSGRGILLMDAFLDELLYNAKGNRAMLLRHRQIDAAAKAPGVPPAPAAPAEAGPLQVTRRDGVTIVELLRQRVSQENIMPIRQVLSEAIEAAQPVVLDMRRVGFITSIFLGLLVSTHKQLSQKGGRFVVAGIQESVREILESVALDNILELVADPEQAVAQLQERPKGER
ncbi:MAG: ATP-binding protein [Planctomycetota bacterium]|jgi:serine/threonine-protein kinase RsbW